MLVEPQPMFHRFSQDVSHLPPPEKFTYPFHYSPHPLCVLAAEAVQEYLTAQTDWKNELDKGKMFGVLVVRNPQGEIGFAAAFSGNLHGRNNHPWFVPPVFDMLQPHEFFRIGEKEITSMNQRIGQLEAAPEYLQLQQELRQHSNDSEALLATSKEQLKADKLVRDTQRTHLTDSAALAALECESRFQKAEYKRLARKLNEENNRIRAALNRYEQEINTLKQMRKSQSAALQQQLFDSFQFSNPAGQHKGLCAIFADTAQKMPPAGAGECAAPKLLQYAFTQGYRPLAMAEFWWGASPKTEIRHHGHYYPACKGKCEPILQHMLEGLEIDENPLTIKNKTVSIPDMVYEDDYLLIVNKPAGMLSVPGKTGQDSVLHLLEAHMHSPLFAVHRLDMDTSGLLMLAKTAWMHKHLQAMFGRRSIGKRYIALLKGEVEHQSGEIDLPLSPDYVNRPRQRVDREEGKPALTRWELLEKRNGQSRVAFYPLTGRTHQLRVHAAHPDGLNCPIVGDPLYGSRAGRLFLHAESLRFVHPATGEELHITVNADF